MLDKLKLVALWILAVAGLAVAVLAGLSEYFPWIASLCTGFSDGCRQTAQFGLYGLSVWPLGAAYYLLLMLALMRARKWVPLVVAAGLGAELALAYVLYSIQAACLFCLANLAVMVLLFLVSLEIARFWQMSTVALLLLVAVHPGLARKDLSPEAQALALVQMGLKAPAKPGPVAQVAGRDITLEELDMSLTARLHDLEQQIFRLRRERLEHMVEDQVLSLEAQARGLDLPGLVAAEVLSKQPPVPPEAVEAYISDNKAVIKGFKGTDEELHQRVLEFLTEQQTGRLVAALAKGLEPKYQVSLSLPEPKARLVQVDAGASPALGAANATILVAEFSDYECPACRKGHETVRKVREMYADKVRWVFKDFPLDMHRHAAKAAEAARCGGEQGRFWETQDALYAAEDLSPDKLPGLAEKIGLDPARFAACLASSSQAPGVLKDLDQAKRIGLEATPTFVIGGRLVSGTPSVERFKELLDAALKEAAPKAPAAP